MADALPLIQTKLFRPPLPRSLVARTRLTNLLDRQPKRPLTLVSAPAGYGKSTLIASWAEASDLPVAWVSLDEHDSDIVIFISYFLAALQSIYPNVGANTSALIQSPEIPTTRLICNTLISEIHHIGKPFVLVLDDYHLVRSASIQDFIEKLLTHPSRHLHLVISTRVDPPLSLSKFRARNQVTEVRLQDLRFTEDEVALLLEKIIGNPVDSKTVTELETQSEGWVTGLRLSALAMRHRLGRDRIHDKLSLDNRYVSEYLVSEILSQQSEHLAEQMLEIAILDRFCAGLCQAVCNIPPGTSAKEAESFIRWLEASNLFVIPLDDQGIWFRYHHLFQAFLEQELQRGFTADEIAALHQRAGDWFAQNDMLEEAVHHALAARDVDRAAHFIEDRRHELMNQEQWSRLQILLKQLPRDFIDVNASLLNIEATIFCVSYNFEALVPTLKRVENILARTDPQLNDGQRAQLEGELAWMWGFVSYWLGGGQKSLEKISEALRVLPPELTFAYARALEYQINACQMTGRFPEALELADKALADEESFGPVFLATIQVSLLVVNILQGDLPNAERAAQKALRLGRECNLYMTIGWALQTLGYVYYQWNDLEAARGYYEQVLELRYRTSVQAQAHSSFGLARTLQALDETKQARRISRAAIEWAQEVGDARMLVEARAWYAQLMLLNGEAPDMHNWAGALGESYSQMIFVEIAHLTLAATWIAERTPHSLANADALLGGLRKFCSRVHNNWRLIEIGALEALLFDALGEQQKALHKLGEAIQIARKGGHIRVFVDLGTPMQQLLRKLQQTEVSPGYIDRILNAFPNAPVLSSRIEPNHPLDLLTQRESEILELLAQHLTNKEIAEQLVLSTGTVKQHLYNIYRKLNVKNRGQAIAVAKDFSR